MTMDNQPNDQKKRSWTRFGLKSLLLLALMIALLLGGFRYGRNVGFVEGSRQGFSEGLVAKVYPVVYKVSDLVSPPNQSVSVFASYDTLIQEIQSEFQPQTWEAAEGPATLAPYPQNLSIVVAQTERGHQDLNDFLETKRSILRLDQSR